MALLDLRTVSYPTAGTATRPDLHVVESIRQRTGVAAADITEGAPVRYDANGKWVPAQGTTAPNARAYGIALRTVKAGQALTVLKTGTVEGVDVSALAYDAPVYLSDTAGRLDTVAGTVSVVVGRVVAAHGHERIGGTPSKLLEVSL